MGERIRTIIREGAVIDFLLNYPTREINPSERSQLFAKQNWILIRYL